MKITSDKKVSLVCLGLSFVVFLMILIWGMSGSITGNEMGYAVLNFYLIMPVMSFVMALILGLKDAYLKWLYPPIIGAFGYVIPSVVFGTSGTVALFFSLIPSLSGLGIGVLISVIRRRKRNTVLSTAACKQ